MDDLVWRPPLLLPWDQPLSGNTTTTATTTTTTTTTANWDDLHDEQMSPMISAIVVACHILRLSQETTFTAACFLHRYFSAIRLQNMMRSTTTATTTTPWLVNNHNNVIKKHNHHSTDSSTIRLNGDGGGGGGREQQHDDDENHQDILVCCIFLACKVEEEPRRLRDFINLSQMLSWDEVGGKVQKEESVKKTSSYSTDDAKLDREKPHHSLLYWKKDPPDLDERYWSIKECIVTTEQHVLRWLAFDVCVSHPHRAIVALIQQQQREQRDQRHKQQQQSIDPEQWQEKQVLLANRSFQILNSVAIYSCRALSMPVLSLATAAIELASSTTTTTTTTTAPVTPVYSNPIHNTNMDDEKVQIAREHMQKVMNRFTLALQELSS